MNKAFGDFPLLASLVQLVERRSPKPDVEGSSPSGRDFIKNIKDKKMNETVNAIQTYLRGVRSEWGKIMWPEKRQVVTETIFVIAIVFVFTVAVYLMDLIFKGLFGLIK